MDIFPYETFSHTDIHPYDIHSCNKFTHMTFSNIRDCLIWIFFFIRCSPIQNFHPNKTFTHTNAHLYDMFTYLNIKPYKTITHIQRSPIYYIHLWHSLRMNAALQKSLLQFCKYWWPNLNYGKKYIFLQAILFQCKNSLFWL